MDWLRAAEVKDVEKVSDCCVAEPVRVLLVEDSLPIRSRIRSMIEESGTGEIVGESGSIAQAQTLFLDLQPDVVLLDLNLSDTGAMPFLRLIKSARPACIVIILTSDATPEARELCQNLGAEYFFEKSSEYERVLEALAEIEMRDARGGQSA